MAPMVWKWILERVVDLPDVGMAFINEVIKNYVPDIEDQHCRSLLERVALRTLEEMVVTNQIDCDVIPLLKALTRQDLGAVTGGLSVKQRFNKELILRVQTEVVLSVLRGDVDGEERDWTRYASELESVFAGADEDNRLLDRKRELCALLKPKNQKPPVVAAYFKKYSLSKLRTDLISFIEEKRELFKTRFLDQLSRDFLDADGALYPAECTEVDASGQQDHVGNVNVESLRALTGSHANKDMDLEAAGQNPKLDETGSPHDMNGTGDRNIVSGTSTGSGRKRLREELRTIQDDIGDDEPEDAQEGNEEPKKARTVSPTFIMSSLEGILHQSVSVKAESRLGPQDGCSSPVKHRVELVKQLSSLNKGDEGMSAPRNITSNVVTRCSSPVHASMNMEGAKADRIEPSRTRKYVPISDVESDADTQVGNRLSIDEDDLIDNCEADDHQKKAEQSLSENGCDRGHSERVVPAEVVMMDRRKEAVTTSPQVKISRQVDYEKVVTNYQSTPQDSQDSQDIYKVNFLEVGSDGNENFCHTCGLPGKLVCCGECPISMHFKCVEKLGLRSPDDDDDWYCPVCVSLKAARLAAEAERAAAAAKEKLISFQEKVRRRSASEGNLLHHHKREKTLKKSSFGVDSLQPEELDKALTLQQPNQEGRNHSEGREDSDPPKASVLPTILKRALHQLKKHCEQDPEYTGEDPLLEFQSHLNRGLVLGEGADRGADSLEPGSGAAGRGEIEVKADEGPNEEERFEHINRSLFLSGRQKITGLRRKRLAWTREEEHVLKEGVKRFSYNGAYGFQWKRILEFGQGTFDPSRTYVDLKDKWRNLVKGVA